MKQPLIATAEFFRSRKELRTIIIGLERSQHGFFCSAPIETKDRSLGLSRMICSNVDRSRSPHLSVRSVGVATGFTHCEPFSWTTIAELWKATCWRYNRGESVL
jgi:hypothetical protein